MGWVTFAVAVGVVLTLAPFPFAGLPRTRFALGLLGVLALTGFVVVGGGFVLLFGSFYCGESSAPDCGPRWGLFTAGLVVLAAIVAVLGVVAREQWRALRSHLARLRS